MTKRPRFATEICAPASTGGALYGMPMQVSLIAAVAQNGTIGRDNQLPWDIREEMQFFLRTTRGHVVITGRKNFEAMGGPLKNRKHAVVSRNPAYHAPGCHVSTTIEDALRFAEAQGESEAFVIGGTDIYTLAFPYAHCIYKSTVLADVPGDVNFPNLPLDNWLREVIGTGVKSDVNEHAFIIERFLRPDAPAPFAHRLAPNSTT